MFTYLERERERERESAAKNFKNKRQMVSGDVLLLT